MSESPSKSPSKDLNNAGLDADLARSYLTSALGSDDQIISRLNLESAGEVFAYCPNGQDELIQTALKLGEEQAEILLRGFASALTDLSLFPGREKPLYMDSGVRELVEQTKKLSYDNLALVLANAQQIYSPRPLKPGP